MIIEYREDNGEGWMCIEHSGIEVRHRLPGPFRVERFIYGNAVILNGSGINWTHFPERPGAVMFFSAEDAEAVCAKLNGGKP